MPWPFLAFVAGVCALHASPVLPSAPVIAALAIGACAATRGARPLAAERAGWVFAAASAHALLADRWHASAPTAERTVTGVVASLPDIDADGARFVFEPDPAQHPELPRRIRVGWYLDEPAPAAGSRWRLKLRLRPPRGSLNPDGFDYERWLAAQWFGATATVRPHPRPVQLAPRAARPLLAARRTLDAALTAALPAHPRRGIVRGLVLGERTELDARDWEVFARTGTAHLMAISGLHVGMIAALAFAVAGALARRVPASAHRAREWGAAAGIVAATLYSALAGFSVPTQRSLCMIVAGAAILLARRYRTAAGAWCSALFVVVAVDALAPLSIGFWLSFAAVGFIAWACMHRRAQPRALVQLARVQWAVTLGLLPLTLWFFQRGSLVAPLTNLVAVPLFTLAIVPGALLGAALALVAPAAGAAWLGVVATVVDWAWWWLTAVADWSWAQRFTPKPPWWTVVLAFAGAAVWLAPRGWPGRALTGAALCAPLLAWSPAPPVPGAWRATVLDVGQGLAVVVRTHTHTLLYDTGPRYGTTSDAGARVVAPFLRAQRVTALDLMMVSHAHADHDGGAASVRDALRVDRVLAGNPGPLGPVAGQCIAGQQWRWDGVAFRVLHPVRVTVGDANANSCVLEIAGAGGTLLLPGDIEWRAELALAAPRGALRPVDVIVAPHHGSRTSSIPRFVARTAARWVVVPASFGNRWSFPHAEVVARWRAADARVLVVGHTGAVTIDADPVSGIAEPVLERQAQSAWWRVE